MIKKLRAKVEELKGLITESQKERSDLRVKLAQATFEIEKVAAEQVSEQRERQPAEREILVEREELDAGIPSRWSTLIPAFRNPAREAIRNAPAHLARQALQAAAALAAGDQAAWSGIKRLRAIPDVWSARIGLHHRLLFRIDADRSLLEVTAFIPRRDLESTIARGNL